MPGKEKPDHTCPQHGKTARDVAVSILAGFYARTKSPPPVQAAVDKALKEARLSDRDAALCTELVYGTLRSTFRLEWLLRHLLKAPDKLPSRVWVILLTATYALLFLDRIPAHATVNWAVSAAQRFAGKPLARVVNAVLRGIARQSAEMKSDAWYIEREPDTTRQISALYSVPIWLVEFWLEAYDEEMCRTVAQALMHTPWTAIRINTTCGSWNQLFSELQEQGGQSCGHAGLLFKPGTWPNSLREIWGEGRFSWQGAGSQRVLAGLHAHTWDGPIWDACCGHGGKTCALLEMGRDVALASDPHEDRLNGLRQELARLGLSAPMLEKGKVQDILPDFVPQTIVLDVPCSGLGTMARRPDIRLQNGMDRIGSLREEQKQILEAAWNILPPGGLIVYLTCTLSPDENEGQVCSFLSRHADAVVEREWKSAPDETGADLMFGSMIRKRAQ